MVCPFGGLSCVRFGVMLDVSICFCHVFDIGLFYICFCLMGVSCVLEVCGLGCVSEWSYVTDLCGLRNWGYCVRVVFCL